MSRRHLPWPTPADAAPRLHLHHADDPYDDDLESLDVYELQPAADGIAPWRRRDSDASSVASAPPLYTRAEEAAVVRKFDRRLVLFVALLYMLSFLDRSNIGNARIAGMDADLQSDPPWAGWYECALTAFYVAYICFEWMAVLWRVVPAHVYVSLLVLSWGVVASMQAVATSYPVLIVLRFCLGIGEAGFTGIPFYLSFFFKRDELAFRTAMFLSAAPLATSFASSLAWLILHISQFTPITSWRLLFLIEGFPSIIVAVFAWIVIPDSPQSARYLTARERKVAQLRLQHSEPSTHHHTPPQPPHSASSSSSIPKPVLHILSVLRDPVAIIPAGMLFFANMAYASMPVFLPTFLADSAISNNDPVTAQALAAPVYLVAFAAVLLAATHSDRRRRRAVPIAIYATVSALGYAVLALAEPLRLSPLARYLAIYPAAAGFFPVVALTIAWGVNNQGSHAAPAPEYTALPKALHHDTPSPHKANGTARGATAYALLQLIGQCGPLIGTRLYPDADAPFFARGMACCAGAMAAVGVLALALRRHLQRQNVRMDRKALEDEAQAGVMSEDGEEGEKEAGVASGPTSPGLAKEEGDGFQERERLVAQGGRRRFQTRQAAGFRYIL